jgi:hypothetical protein
MNKRIWCAGIVPRVNMCEICAAPTPVSLATLARPPIASIISATFISAPWVYLSKKNARAYFYFPRGFDIFQSQHLTGANLELKQARISGKPNVQASLLSALP